MRTLAILPVKRLEQAKQRLSASLGPERRRELATAMLSDVLATLTDCEQIESTLVVTSDAEAAACAGRHGAQIIEDADEDGQSAAANQGIQRALDTGYERVLLVPGDCPALDADELIQLLDTPGAPPSVTIVPDRHNAGTNALLLAPPNALVPAFGEGSLARHCERATSSGADWQVLELKSLAYDVDTPADLRALCRLLAKREGTAPRTRALLIDEP